MKTFACLILLLISSAVAAVDLVKVDKSERQMHLLYQGEVVKSYRIALGGNPKGHKRQEGDHRTPEGTYILDYKKEDSSYYRSMHINYPNQMDIADAEQRGVSAGSLIMVHGQPNGLGWLAAKTQLRDWTRGCIALSNPEMDEFMALVQVGTPIQIEW